MSKITHTASATPPRIVPERIREAREARGHTVEIFAEMLGVTRQAVGQYETGQITPSAEALSKIIAVTGQPPAFFTASRARDVGNFGSPFWRGLKRMNRPDRLRIARRLEWASDIVSYLESFIDLPKVNLPAFDWDWETGDDYALERIAAAVRDFWQLGRGPIFHISKVLEANGIVIIKEPVECEDMDAVSRWQGGRPFILCSADRDELPRFNFDLAHELGHVLLHNGVEVTSENINKIERQANYFAGAFLLPRELFSREVVSTSIHYFLKLKERWRVSVAAMVYRCKELGILSPTQVSYLYRQLSAKGMRIQEPLDTAFKTEEPSILVAALEMLIEHRVRTKAEIVDDLSLNAHDIEMLCGTGRGFFGEKLVQLRLRSDRYG
ncbi:helix-turn-helix domain-containing protein [Mesorhizobium sp. UC22_110]|uniref:helix-turn-helix domain-containing protein n=1 Tax=unclassified Mesorhizobium TaxID=325217 RepID=UPI0036716F4F